MPVFTVPDSHGSALHEFNPCHDSGTGQFCAGHSGSFAVFERQALHNLLRTSRTATGVSDTSSSADKPTLAAEGGALKAKADQNFRRALRSVWNQRRRRFDSPEDVGTFVVETASTVSEGLLKPGQSVWRTWETKNHQTPVREIPDQFKAFTRELHQRLSSGADPVGTAAWVEYVFDGHLHPMADGVGRTAKALSAFVLARAGHGLPTYRGRDDYYANINKSLAEWTRYYRTMFA